MNKLGDFSKETILTTETNDDFKNTNSIDRPFLEEHHHSEVISETYYGFDDINIKIDKSTTADYQELPIKDKFVFKRQQSDQGYFEVEQAWIGTVIEVLKDSFLARLKDLTNLSDSYENTEILMKEISDDEKKYIESGAIFYWKIGLLSNNSSNKRRVSEIRFQKYPKWEDKDIANAERAAKKIIDGKI